MKLSEAIAIRLRSILKERRLTQYQLFIKSGVAQTTISSIINAEYKTVKLETIYGFCQGINMEITDFFNDDVFKLNNLID